MKDFETNQHDWNMAVAFLQRLDKRLDEAQLARANGELLKWYRTLRSVFNQIHFKFIETKETDVQEKELIAQFEECKTTLMNAALLNNLHQQGAVSQIELKLDDLERTLTDLLYKFELVFGKNNNKSIEEQIGADY